MSRLGNLYSYFAIYQMGKEAILCISNEKEKKPVRWIGQHGKRLESWVYPWQSFRNAGNLANRLFCQTFLMNLGRYFVDSAALATLILTA